jgi:hypothetical protein
MFNCQPHRAALSNHDVVLPVVVDTNAQPAVGSTEM